MKLLHLDSSALSSQSVTRELSASIVHHEQLKNPALEVVYRDLDQNPLPHFTSQSLTPSPQQKQLFEQILQELLEADIVVIGAPMYNFSIPSTLKAWIDRVAVAGKTFRYTENGPEGLLGNKKVWIASGRGGIHGNGSSDFQETYLRQIFAFLGVDHLSVVRAEGVALSPSHKEQALKEAHALLQ